MSQKLTPPLTLQKKRVDIDLISETHFTNNFYVNIPGYHSYRVNYPDNSAHTSAAIYILKYTLLLNFITDDIQSCVISLTLNNITII